MRFVALVVAGLALACGSGAPEQLAPPVSIEVDGSDLWATSESGGRELLAADGKGYSAQVSPSGEWVVADIALFSNLQITRAYRRDFEAESFVEEHNISIDCWAEVERKLGIAREDVLYPRTRFLSWAEDEGALLVEVTGELPEGGEISETVRIKLGRDSPDPMNN